MSGRNHSHLRAIIFSFGCMIAESAVTRTLARASSLSLTWPSDDIVRIRQVDDDDLVGVIDGFPTVADQSDSLALRGYSHADEVVRLQCQRLEGYRVGLDTESGELEGGARDLRLVAFKSNKL